jgi:hypothetical protein
MGEQEARLAQLIDDGKRAGIVDPALSTEAIVALCHAISLGFAMFGSIDRQLPAAEGWNAVIQRLINAARPSESTHSPTKAESNDPVVPNEES